MRRVDSKGLVVGVPGRYRLQASYVRSVTQFRLRITSNILILFSFLEK